MCINRCLVIFHIILIPQGCRRYYVRDMCFVGICGPVCHRYTCLNERASLQVLQFSHATSTTSHQPFNTATFSRESYNSQPTLSTLLCTAECIGVMYVGCRLDHFNAVNTHTTKTIQKAPIHLEAPPTPFAIRRHTLRNVSK